MLFHFIKHTIGCFQISDSACKALTISLPHIKKKKISKLKINLSFIAIRKLGRPQSTKLEREANTELHSFLGAEATASGQSGQLNGNWLIAGNSMNQLGR